MPTNWSLRYAHTNIPISMEDFMGDQFTLFYGMYDVPSYILWYMRADKTIDIWSGIGFRFALNNGENQMVFMDDFVIKSVTFDPVSKLYRIYAESEIYNNLKNGILVPSKIYNSGNPTSGKDLISKAIQSTAIQVLFRQPITDRVEYISTSFDPTFSMLDLIIKVCNENRWEWFLRGDGLFISDILTFEDKYITQTDVEEGKQKFVEFVDMATLTMKGDVAQPGSLYGYKGRVIWCKYKVGGKIGDQMECMLYRSLVDYYSRYYYMQTLNGIAWQLGQHRLSSSSLQNPIIIGKAFGEFNTLNASKYTVPKFGGDVRTLNPNIGKLEFKEKYTTEEDAIIYKEDVKLTTPYAGDNVGILFPQESSHRVLFTPQDNREYGLLGPAYFTDRETMPSRASEKDFRLQLPDNAVIYNKNNNSLIIVAPQKIDITVGNMLPTSTTSPASGSNILMDSDSVDISSPSAAASIEVTDSGITVELGANKVEVTASEVKINNTTLKVIQGVVEINGTLKVNGMIDVSTVKTTIHPNVDAIIKTKIPPVG